MILDLFSEETLFMYYFATYFFILSNHTCQIIDITIFTIKTYNLIVLFE